MDFAIPKDIADLKAEVDAFVRRDVIPFESDPRWTAHGPTDELRRDLNAKAKAAGLLAVHVSKELPSMNRFTRFARTIRNRYCHQCRSSMIRSSYRLPIDFIDGRYDCPMANNRMKILKEVSSTFLRFSHSLW